MEPSNNRKEEDINTITIQPITSGGSPYHNEQSVQVANIITTQSTTSGDPTCHNEQPVQVANIITTQPTTSKIEAKTTTQSYNYNGFRPSYPETKMDDCCCLALFCCICSGDELTF